MNEKWSTEDKGFWYINDEVQKTFNYRYWVLITIIAFYTSEYGYTKTLTYKNLSKTVEDFNKADFNQLLNNLENHGYIKQIKRTFRRRQRNYIVLEKPLYEMFKEDFKYMHEPIIPPE